MKFVSVQNVVNLICDIGIEQVLRELADYLERDFKRWESFEKVPRYASHSRDGVIELMPTSDGSKFAFKLVNGHPKNFERNLQTVVSLGVLSDVATGYPELISEMTILTALRTAATSALAARHLARPDSRSMAVIGLGSQSEFQAFAFKALLGIRKLRAFDVDPAAALKFARNMKASGIEIVFTDTAEEAVAGVDIITTVTADKRKAVVLSDNLVGAGVHINAVGGDCPGKTELQAGILNRSTVFVEFEAQTRIEGEIQQMPADFPVTEFWRVISRQHPGRTKSEEITVFDSVGFAMEDFTMLRFLSDKVEGTTFYANIDLITSPTDPKDLFGLLVDGAAALQRNRLPAETHWQHEAGEGCNAARE